jgi:hypothetical protein
MFWLNDVTYLFNDFKIIPDPEDDLETKCNLYTRIILLLWMLMVIFDYEYASIFLINSLVFIIILYYIQRKTMTENYTPCEYLHPKQVCSPSIPLKDWQSIPKGNNLKIVNPSKNRFCNDQQVQDFGPNFQSNYQKLAGRMPDKMNIPPIVVSQPAAWDFWSNNQSVPMGINKQNATDLYSSGYISKHEISPCIPNSINQAPKEIPVYSEMAFKQPNCENGNFCGLSYPVREDYSPHVGSQIFNSKPNYQPLANNVWINEKGTDGDLLDSTYNPQQLLEHHIPSNMPAGVCNRDNVFNQYNENIFTQMLGPDMYNRTDVVESTNSNLGISFTQQFEPVTLEGNTYVSRDPRIIYPEEPIPERIPIPENSNVTDPRTFGYGTSYRSYIDPMTGRPRFYYDDIEAIRRPNNIVRSNIDHLQFAQKYGPMEPCVANVRGMVQDKFIQESNDQRQELQERYMRKYNAQVGWQKRLAPMRPPGFNGGSFRS